jgi:DNA topoisomerase-2
MVDDDSDDEMYIRPAVKKQKTAQAAVTDFFDKVPAEPSEAVKKPAARKASGSKPAAAKKKPVAKKKVESDDDEVMASDTAEARPAAPKRAARGKIKKYIEIGSSSDGDKDDDMYGE